MMDLLKKFNTKLCEIKSKLSKLNPSPQTVNTPQQDIHVYHHHDHWGYHPPIFINEHNVTSSHDDEDRAAPALGLFIGGIDRNLSFINR